jgi:hypothetical protein
MGRSFGPTDDKTGVFRVWGDTLPAASRDGQEFGSPGSPD